MALFLALGIMASTSRDHWFYDAALVPCFALEAVALWLMFGGQKTPRPKPEDPTP